MCVIHVLYLREEMAVAKISQLGAFEDRVRYSPHAWRSAMVPVS